LPRGRLGKIHAFGINLRFVLAAVTLSAEKLLQKPLAADKIKLQLKAVCLLSETVHRNHS
jgi:hypothetical protein